MKKQVILTGILTLAFLLFGASATPAQAQGEDNSCGATYVVQPGDYLTRIANQCEVSYRALIGANPQIENPNLIYPGQMINIPGQDDSGDDVVIPVTGGSTYIVQPGDTLSTIADRFEVSIDDLFEANPGLSRTQPVRAGQQVRLPEGAARVPTLSVTPTSANPNTLVTIAATGFRANTEVLLGFGQVDSEFFQIGQATTNANGAVYRTLRVPEWAEVDDRYVFVVQREDDPDVRAISNPLSLVSAGDPGTIPVTGPDFYVVQSGDTLSEIAARYDTSIEELLDLNPSIEDPALIFTGQRIDLPEGVRPVDPWAGISDRRVVPDQQLRVRALNFPPNAFVDVRLAPVGETWQAVVDARADDQGEIVATITVPDEAADGEEWHAIVTTTERANVTRVTSRSFVIVE